MNATRRGAPAIRVSGLEMAYGSNEVLKGIDLTINAGEVVVLLGPNGAGKTTMVEIFEGFRQPSSGTVEVLGVNPLTAGEDWRARIGIVLQSWRDHAKWRVGELLDYLGSYYRPYSTSSIQRPWPTEDLLELVGLAGERNKKVSTLSGGRRRRLDVAVGLVGRPELLFLDEPTAGFDPSARRDFHDLIAGLADVDTTVLMTTHDLDEAEKVADRTLILANGRIVADGSPDELRRLNFGTADVRWSDGERRHVHSTDDPAGFLRGLLAPADAVVDDLEVRRATLEDTYIALVNQAEGAQMTADQEAALRALTGEDDDGEAADAVAVASRPQDGGEA